MKNKATKKKINKKKTTKTIKKKITMKKSKKNHKTMITKITIMKTIAMKKIIIKNHQQLLVLTTHKLAKNKMTTVRMEKITDICSFDSILYYFICYLNSLYLYG